MALQIANPGVVAKIDRLARSAGISKTAAVERAVDALLAHPEGGEEAGVWQRMEALLAQLDLIPDRPQPFDPLDWDEQGLPR